jgi:protein subunit release factor B
MKKTIQYPWQQLKKGQGFFVPALDTEKAKEEGLKAALTARVKGKAYVGIKSKQLGVVFVRVDGTV